MNKDLLTAEEKQILKDFEAGKLNRVKNFPKETTRYRAAAKYTHQKTKNINIRLPHRDLHHLKAIAKEKGLPYQTLISSLLHQYSSRQKK